MKFLFYRKFQIFTCLSTSGQRVFLRALILKCSCIDVQVLIEIQHCDFCESFAFARSFLNKQTFLTHEIYIFHKVFLLFLKTFQLKIFLILSFASSSASAPTCKQVKLFSTMNLQNLLYLFQKFRKLYRENTVLWLLTARVVQSTSLHVEVFLVYDRNGWQRKTRVNCLMHCKNPLHFLLFWA